MTTTRPRITIIGPGRVGSSLAKLAFRAGWRFAAIAGGHHPERTAHLAEELGAPVLPLAKAAAAGELILLTVRDNAIPSVCDQLAAAGGLDRKPIVAHCSGALSSADLASARRIGCPVASIHPLQTFPDVEAAVARLPGTYCFLEGDADATTALEQLARDIHAIPVQIDPAVKPLYHAAAVFSSNYILTLLDAAISLFGTTGLDEPHCREALLPILHATVHNFQTKGASGALTGPLARGDEVTVEHHVENLRRHDPEILRLYAEVGARTIRMACQKGALDEHTAARLAALLKGAR
jgi:predicted short-subunit dehydrogenase-like oxidoreductase (DUF2520 family)